MNNVNGRLAEVDVALKRLAQVAIPVDVERRLESRVQEFCRHPQAVRDLPKPQRRIHRRVVRASVGIGLAALLLTALFLTFGQRDAWAQVAEAMGSKPWVRWTFQVPEGTPLPEDFRVPECWYSAAKKVFAGRAVRSSYYTDLAMQESYDYWPETNSVSRSLMSDNQIVNLQQFGTLLRLVSEGDQTFKTPESAVQILERTRREVSEGDRRWIDYSFACRDSRRGLPDYRVTFRVDSETQLPVEMRSTEKYSANDPTDERIYAIDYPESGPSDIYDLGVPRDAKVVDRRRAKVETAQEIKEFLAAYVSARSKPLEPYSTVVLESSPQKSFSDIFGVYRGGSEVPFEEADYDQLIELRKKLWAGEIVVPDGVDRAKWWSEQVSGLSFKAAPGGGQFLPDQIGYPREFLTFGASPVDNPDCHITLDRQPMFGPAGTVLLNIRTETTHGFNDEFFWIDPSRDYLVLRSEIYFSKDHAAWNNFTRIIDKVEQSPSGRWYVTEARYGRIEEHGDDLPAEPVLAGPVSVNSETEKHMGPVSTMLWRYIVTFK